MQLRMFPVISPAIFAFVVVILGYFTPGYNHINYTMSRLAIEKYGIIQSLNFLQLAFGITILGNLLSFGIKKSGSKVAIRTMFYLCAMFLAIAAVVPTDPIENIPLHMAIYTPLGLIHAGTVILFLIVSPIGIHRIANILASEPKYTQYGSLTRIIGYAAFIASVVWFICFILGIGLEYRGIFQKIIAIPVLYWLSVVSVATQKNHISLSPKHKADVFRNKKVAGKK